ARVELAGLEGGGAGRAGAGGRSGLGEDAHDEAGVRGEDAPGPLADLGGGGVAVAVEVALEGVGLAEVELVLVELVGLGGGGLERGELAELDGGLALLELLGLDAVLEQAADLL